jgi:para-nitrobenzyl esterase
MPRHPFYPDAAPQSLHIPMIIGNTHDETRAFLRGDAYENIGWDDLPDLLIPNMRVDIRPETVIERYRAWYPERSPSELFYNITTAARSWRAAVIEAEERARAGTPAYVYQLDWGNPYAPHTFDIPLVFDNTAVEGSLTGNSETARNMAALMSEAFIALARSGNPNHAALPTWTPYSLANRETLVFDWPPRMENDPRGQERALFATVPYVQPGT